METPILITRHGEEVITSRVLEDVISYFAEDNGLSIRQVQELRKAVQKSEKAIYLAERVEIPVALASEFLADYEAGIMDDTYGALRIEPHGLKGFIDVDDVFVTRNSIRQLVSQKPSVEFGALKYEINSEEGREIYMKSIGDKLFSGNPILGIHSSEEYKNIITSPEKNRRTVQRADIVTLLLLEDNSYQLLKLGKGKILGGVHQVLNPEEIERLLKCRIGSRLYVPSFFETAQIMSVMPEDTLIKRLTPNKKH